MDNNSNAINWFEIPVENMERAVKFYSEIFDIEFKMTRINESDMAIFPSKEGSVGGALIKEKAMNVGREGTILYLNANPDIQTVVNKLEQAGGELLTPILDIENGIGYIAYFKDSEGNSLGLHSNESKSILSI